MFNYHNPYPTVRIPVFARNVVSTSHPLAAQAGPAHAARRAATPSMPRSPRAAMMTIVEPVSSGLGSDAFASFGTARELHGLNASGAGAGGVDPRSTSAAIRRGRARHGEPADARLGLGHRAGRDRRLGRAARTFGKLPFADLLAAGDRDRRARLRCAAHRRRRSGPRPSPELERQPGFAAAFLPRGRAPEVGELFRFPAAARTLRRIAETQRREPSIDGEIAERIVAHAATNGGAMTVDDLAAYRPEWVEPIGTDYRGYDVARDPAQRPGHRGADRAGHPRALRHRQRCRSTAPTRSTCRSRR